MNRTRRRRIERVFEDALAREVPEREAYLQRACAGDPELLGEVRALLAADALAERIFGDGADDPAAEDDRIGSYRVIQEIGRGGMGVVYLAERADGQYRGRVAIKLVPVTHRDDPVHQRFLAERQILAGLDHPNIARLLDGGVTDDGRPFLVMEYVDGLPITTYCERHRLGVEARLRLFLDVCDAVQHAHQNLVIHRDLKPGNILVTPEGRVRLLDFGIAKLLNPALSPALAPVTRLDLRAMTPEYGSPEQVRGDSITTVSDVYSLGVLLYELLTGTPPYRLTTHSPAEVVTLVCERDPETPSARVARKDPPPTGAGGAPSAPVGGARRERGASPEWLKRRLQGDLDSIVMRAMRKEPGRRYASADLLGEDLRRHLRGLPVEAHRGSRRYRLGKLMRRHRVEALAAGLTLASLVAGAGAAGWKAAQARRDRDRAEVSRLQAERALAESEEVTTFLTGLFEAADATRVTLATEVTARDLLERGVTRAEDLSSQPTVQARMLDVLGQMYYRLGQYGEAQRLLEQAVAIRRAIPGGDPTGLATSLIHLSWVHRSRVGYAEARPFVEEAMAIRRRVLPADHPDLAVAIYELAWLSDLEEQERLDREAIAILARTGALPSLRVRLLQQLATNLRRQGRLAESVESDRAALRMAELEFGSEHYETGYAMIHLADQVRDIEHDPPAAERLYRRGLELMERHWGENHVRLIHGLNSLADLQARQGNHREAEALLRRSLAIQLAATGSEHPAAADHMRRLAVELRDQGRLPEAEALARQALDLSRALRGPDHPQVASAMAELGDMLFLRGRAEQAERMYDTAVAIFASGGHETRAPLGEIRRRYGRLLVKEGRYERAEVQLLASLEELESAYPAPDHPNAQETRRALMELYRAWGKPSLVERYRVPPGEYVPY